MKGGVNTKFKSDCLVVYRRTDKHAQGPASSLKTPNGFYVSDKWDSNPRPQAWKASALSTELLSHFNLSSRRDSNSRHPAPKAGILTGLNYYSIKNQPMELASVEGILNLSEFSLQQNPCPGIKINPT